jgi:hypothetical protein
MGRERNFHFVIKSIFLLPIIHWPWLKRDSTSFGRKTIWPKGIWSTKYTYRPIDWCVNLGQTVSTKCLSAKWRSHNCVDQCVDRLYVYLPNDSVTLTSTSVTPKCLWAKCLWAKCLWAKCLWAKCLSVKCMSANCMLAKCLLANCC